MFCACKYSVFFVLARSDSARAGCTVVFGCSTNQRLASGEGGPGHPRCVPSTRPVKRDGTTGLVWLGLPNSNATATMIQEPEAEVSACVEWLHEDFLHLDNGSLLVQSDADRRGHYSHGRDVESPDGRHGHMTCTFVAVWTRGEGVFGCVSCVPCMVLTKGLR
jgi:hypothetical protein